LARARTDSRVIRVDRPILTFSSWPRASRLQTVERPISRRRAVSLIETKRRSSAGVVMTRRPDVRPGVPLAPRCIPLGLWTGFCISRAHRLCTRNNACSASRSSSPGFGYRLFIRPKVGGESPHRKKSANHSSGVFKSTFNLMEISKNGVLFTIVHRQHRRRGGWRGKLDGGETIQQTGSYPGPRQSKYSTCFLC
jgi:hypothetical protein